jgi:hypothetical protein
VSRLGRREAPTADALLDRLEQTIYSPEKGFCLARQIRTATGIPERLRVADGAVIDTNPPPRGGDDLVVHILEVKRAWDDYAREWAQPEKRRPFQEVGVSWSVVVPAPASAVIGKVMPPIGVGLIEVGTGEPLILQRPHERPPQTPPADMLRALFRQMGVQRGTGAAAEEHMQRIVELLPGNRARLACDHAPLIPRYKTLPERVLCWSCVEGLPPDAEVLALRVDEAPADVLGALRDRIDLRLGIPLHEEVVGIESCAACHVRELSRQPVPATGCPSCGALPTPSTPPGPGIASCAPPPPKAARARAAGGG